MPSLKSVKPSSVTARLAEHDSVDMEFKDMGGNGTLPAYCSRPGCKGKLDFTLKGLKCRECGDELIID